MGREEILEVMAKAIRSADKTYFNEDYSEQARTVMVELHRAGYAIMPHGLPTASSSSSARTCRSGACAPWK
jgi:hypothetical protein